MARSPIRYDYANRRLVYLHETSAYWIIAGHVSLSRNTRGNSHSPSTARPVPTTSTSAEKEPSSCDRDHSPHSIGGGLVFLEGVQLTTHTLFPTFPNGAAGSNQAGISPEQHTTSPALTTPMRILTPGTIKENRMLTCGVCNDPVHTTINSITIDSTNLRLIWTITLQNQSGSQQTDYFAQFSLQDPLGNTYEGTGNLNTDFYVDVGQTVFKTEIFPFLPRPASHILTVRFGISGLTYDPLPFTF